jgi:hypothetical protein
MGLLDLLKDPTAYRVGTTGQNAASKGIKFPHRDKGGPLLGDRVTWDITDENANPAFRGIGGIEGLGISHGKTNLIDSFIRGGAETAFNRRAIDVDRIGKFFLSPNGIQFIGKQVALQALNPRPQKIYNLGINTLASVATAGVSNIQRGGLLGGTIGKLLKLDGHTYLTELLAEYDLSDSDSEISRHINRESNYGLGDPGAPTSEGGLKEIIGFKNPFGDKDGYNVMIGGSIDKVNKLPIFKNSNSIPDDIYSKAKDFVPFRFEVINQDGGDNNIIVFRAFLDSVSDDYSATHNTFKYNGRGEEFFTYNKFQRKIQISFKVAAQTRWEMKPIYQKLNYLVAQTAPNYSSTGRIRTPYCKLTVGHWFNKIPGLITQVGLTWQTNYPWEIALDRKISTKTKEPEGKDKDMLILPHVLDVSLSFQPIHKFTPSNDIWKSPFIGIDGDKVWDNDWMKELFPKKSN